MDGTSGVLRARERRPRPPAPYSGRPPSECNESHFRGGVGAQRPLLSTGFAKVSPEGSRRFRVTVSVPREAPQEPSRTLQS